MPTRRTIIYGLLLLCWALACRPRAAARAEEPFRYREGNFEKGQLRYINGLPVLQVAGTPTEIGRQEAALAADGARALLNFPKEMLRHLDMAHRWPAFLAIGKKMLPRFPPDHLAELNAFAAQSHIDRDLLLSINTMVDAYRDGFGCSSLVVDPQRSKTGGPLFGRNLDFYTFGMLYHYSLVTVYRPKGKHAFASIGFPGLFGCLSGMNDAGLALAIHEVFYTRDGAPVFNARGIPCTLLFRRILEECTTVAQAEKLLRASPRTTLFNLALCDRHGGAVAEVTPKTVVVRRGASGVLACANEFRSHPLAALFVPVSERYRILLQAAEIPKLGLADVAHKLDEVNQGKLTLQTMIFEPASLRLHLAIGSCPSSALPLKALDLKPLFQPHR